MQTGQDHYFVYIYGSQPRSHVKIGIAGDLQQHVAQEKQAPAVEAGAAVGEVPKLVYYEHYDKEETALTRERQIKEGGEDSAFRLIESMNPNWLDLSDTL